MPIDAPPPPIPALIELAAGNTRRDPQLAVRAEFDMAKAAGTMEAWNLFLERHPDNALSDAARRERAKLPRGVPSRP
jgi:hypothetical protein